MAATTSGSGSAAGTLGDFIAAGFIPEDGEPIAIIGADGKSSGYKIGNGVDAVDKLPALSKGDAGPQGNPGVKGDPGGAFTYASPGHLQRSGCRQHPRPDWQQPRVPAAASAPELCSPGGSHSRPATTPRPLHASAPVTASRGAGWRRLVIAAGCSGRRCCSVVTSRRPRSAAEAVSVGSTRGRWRTRSVSRPPSAGTFRLIREAAAVTRTTVSGLSRRTYILKASTDTWTITVKGNERRHPRRAGQRGHRDRHRRRRLASDNLVRRKRGY